VILGAHARPGELQDVAVGELRRAVERPRRASMMHNLVVASENDEIVKMHNLVVASENDEIVNQKIIEEGVMTLAKMQAVSQGSRKNHQCYYLLLY
jgi:predicted alpha/beta hydrolase family esterase